MGRLAAVAVCLSSPRRQLPRLGMDFGRAGIIVPDCLPGSVYVTPDEKSGIFLAPEDSAALVGIIEQVENEATIAGPELELTVLRELRQILGTATGSVTFDTPWRRLDRAG